MNYIYVGDIVNTHGLKGEIRILSGFKFKDIIFKPNAHLYIGKNKDQELITSYRVHKDYDMVKFEGIDDITDVLKYKGEKAYIDRNEFDFPSYLSEDLIGLEAYDQDKLIGVVSKIINNGVYDILVINGNKKNMVPNINEYIDKIDFDNKKIYIKVIKGLLNED